MRTDWSINIPFRTQQFLLLAAQAGSFHKAARTFGVHPSVLARHIDRLENDLGVKLFDRDRNSFSITEPGRIFVREIQEAMTHAARAWDLTRYQARIEQGPFRLGYSAYIHTKLVPMLERLDFPDSTKQSDETTGKRSGNTRSYLQKQELRVVLETGSTINLVDDVLRGRLHASFGIQPILEEDLWVKPIMREPFCLCISKNHRLAKQSSVYAKDMDGEMVFFLPQAVHPGFYDRTLEYIASTGARPVWKEVLSFTHAMEIVAYNFGVALLPQSVARHSHMGVIFKPITDKLLWIETALFSRRDQQDSRIQELLDALLLQLRPFSPGS
ncbi:MAG: LysR family transcriptional regulator [Acidobacteriaceae bacterium]